MQFGVAADVQEDVSAAVHDESFEDLINRVPMGEKKKTRKLHEQIWHKCFYRLARYVHH